MTTITAQMAKELRDRTGAGFLDCKKALTETDGDVEKAIDKLREWGLAAAGKKAGRAADQGLIEAYIHGAGRLGVLVEVNCETDFVARTDVFKAFAHDIAMQVAAKRPLYVSKEDVPQELLDRERAVLMAQAREEGRPEAMLDRIVTGRLAKFYGDVCLLEQQFIRDQEKAARTVGELVRETIAKFGENIQIKRFVRMELGEEAER
ncbi:MAG: translation elongation factor Ts [Bacillota bacterium]|nr:translation elongation factor Ts [Bacillota bacterium]